MSNSSTDAYPCFSADNVGPDGVSVFGDLPDFSAFAASAIGDFMQNLWIEVPMSDGIELVKPARVNVNALAGNGSTRVATAGKTAPSFLITNQIAIADNQSDSSILSGYNVYRTAETGVGPYTKLNPSPISATTYVDTYPSTLVAGTFKYFVTTLYKGSSDNNYLPCEPSTDTITVTFPAVGINELTNGQVMIYPNPANDFVNVKSNTNISRIDVVNFIGQTVYSNTTVDAKTARIDVALYTPGVYFVKVSTSEGVRMVKITVTH
jgi:hypothetical protein